MNLGRDSPPNSPYELSPLPFRYAPSLWTGLQGGVRGRVPRPRTGVVTTTLGRRLATVWKDFHRFLKEISFWANDFSACMGFSKIEGLNSKMSGTESPDASLPPAATHAGP